MACFFFQAEDGIRDGHVTGVQTCALPISGRHRAEGRPVTVFSSLGPCLTGPAARRAALAAASSGLVLTMATTTASAMEPVRPDPAVVDTQATASTPGSDAAEVTHTVVSGDTT